MKKNNEIKEKKRVLIIGIIMLLIVLVGSTYAFFTYSKTGKNLILTSGKMSVEFSSGTNSVSIANAYPISDAFALENLNKLSYIDFKVTGDVSKDAAFKYEIYLEEGAANTLDSNYIKIYLEDIDKNQMISPTIYKRFPATTYPKSSNGKVIYDSIVTTKYEKSFRLYAWIDENYSQNDVSQTFSFKVNLYAYNSEKILLVQTIEDLVDISNRVKDGESFAETNIILTRDLDFALDTSYNDAQTLNYHDINGNGHDEPLITELTTGNGFLPIGSATTKFQGNFEGNNHTISNIHITNDTTNSNANVGLFGAIENSNIRNLTLTGMMENSNTSVNIGGISGSSYGNNTIFNCKNYATVKNTVANTSTGGIVGSVESGNLEIINSANHAEISNGMSVGGLVGYSKANLTINNCTNNAAIKNELGNIIGGLFGGDDSSVESLKTSIINSHNKGIVTLDYSGSTITGVGGLVGVVYKKLDITDSSNDSEVSTDLKGTSTSGYIGGIVGASSGSGAITTINNTNNNANVKVILSKHDKYNGLGGILGWAYNNTDVTINNCQNLADRLIYEFKDETVSRDMENHDKNSGGIVGVNNKSTVKINNSINKANIINGTKLGGIIGYNYTNATAKLNNVANIGQLQTDFSASVNSITLGGIVSYNAYGGNNYIINSYNEGNITYNGTDTVDVNLSGIIGLINGTQDKGKTTNYIINSYNVGNVVNTTNNNFVSGIFSEHPSTNNIDNTIYLNNVFNLGNLTSASKYGIGYVNKANSNILNSYYWDNVYASNEGQVGEHKSLEDMKKSTFVDELNNHIDSDSKGIGGVKLSSINAELGNYSLNRWYLGSNSNPNLKK